MNGKTISLLPLFGDVSGVTLQGFQYPLKDRTLHIDETLGISNELITDVGTVCLRSGYLMIVQNR